MKNFFKVFFPIVVIVGLYSIWGIVLTNKEQTRAIVQKVKKISERKLGLDQPCSKPLEFSIGQVDPNFNISQAELLDFSLAAASVWNKASGREMLKYNPQSQFKINLIFDSRQEATMEAEEMKNNLHDLEESYKEISAKYNSLNAVYQKKADAYNKALEEYKKDASDFNKQVKYWNEKGGAPENVYEELKDEQEKLEKEFETLDDMRKEIRNIIKKSNDLAGLENKVASNYNANLNTYKNEFGDAREFEKGVFSGKEINIYQFKEKSDLEMTLIHELGHYLGLDHVENSKSIMYYLMGDQDLENPTLTKEDAAVLGGICK